MPTFPLEESDYIAGSGPLAGDRIFKNADPPTTFREQSANAVWHGMRTVTKQESVSGDLLDASYAAALAGGFVNFAKSVRRASRRLQAAEIQTTTVSATPLTVTVPPDIYAIMLVDASPTPLAGESLIHPISSANAQNKNRFIFVLNQTADFRLVGHGFSGRYMRLAPGEGCWLYGLDDVGSNNTFWTPIGELDDAPNGFHTFNAKWYSNFTTPEATAAFDMIYMRHGPGRRLVTINYPTAGIILAESANAFLLASSDGFADTPRFLWMIETPDPSYTPYIPISLNIGGTNEIGFLHSGDGNLFVQRSAGSFPTGTQIYISPMSVTYIAEHA